VSKGDGGVCWEVASEIRFAALTVTIICGRVGGDANNSAPTLHEREGPGDEFEGSTV
jgi:hypothetical protein